ncbi:hypothetical protein CR513_38829, partial [Mucuna pruriens]
MGSEYKKIHSCKSSKEMCDTLGLPYKGTSQVRDFKISMLVHRFELFKMEDNEIIDLMFGTFQTIINNLISLGKTYNNYDHITKILRSLLRRWRPQSIALKAQKAFEGSTSKAFKVEKSCGNTSDKDSDEDEISFISRKIQSMWKQRRGLRWKNNFKSTPRKQKAKCRWCVMNEEKEKKKSLMATWEDLDLSSLEDKDEEANLCLMVDITFEDEDNEETKSSQICQWYKKFKQVIKIKQKSTWKIRFSLDVDPMTGENIQKNCPNLQRLTQKDPRNFGYLNQLLFLLQMCLTAGRKPLSWYLDSGCLRHMTGDEYMFQDLKLKKGG